GKPLGYALENFNIRYAELVNDLNEELEFVNSGRIPDEDELAGMWIATNDARSYILLGDPAVRLPLAADDAVLASRPVIEITGPARTPRSPPFDPRTDTSITTPISDTEKRFRDRRSVRDAVSFDITVPPLLRRNSPDRVRKRLRRLGLPSA